MEEDDEDTSERCNGSQKYTSRKIQEVLEKWNQTDFGHITTPALNFIELYPVGSLFLLIFALMIVLPVLFAFVFLIATLIMTISGSFIVFGTISSIVLGGVGVLVFFLGMLSICLTAACVVGYNVTSGVKELFSS